MAGLCQSRFQRGDYAAAVRMAEEAVARGAGEILLVAVELVQGRRCEQLYGTCQPGPNMGQAVVYAVLDALNRRLEMMLFKAGDEDE